MGKRGNINKKKEKEDLKARRGCTKLQRAKVGLSFPWEVTRVGLPGKNSGIQTMVTKSVEKLFGYNFGKKTWNELLG